MFFMVTLFEVV